MQTDRPQHPIQSKAQANLRPQAKADMLVSTFHDMLVGTFQVLRSELGNQSLSL